MKKELEHLTNVERPSISKQIGEAIEKGDISENAEYDAAKEAQGLLEARIAKLEDLIANGRLIDESQIDTSKVYILSKVKIKHLKLKKDFEYTLVAENEADIKLGKISIESPIGKGLVGKEIGDIADVETPNGIVQFEVLGISR